MPELVAAKGAHGRQRDVAHERAVEFKHPQQRAGVAQVVADQAAAEEVRLEQRVAGLGHHLAPVRAAGLLQVDGDDPAPVRAVVSDQVERGVPGGDHLGQMTTVGYQDPPACLRVLVVEDLHLGAGTDAPAEGHDEMAAVGTERDLRKDGRVGRGEDQLVVALRGAGAVEEDPLPRARVPIFAAGPRRLPRGVVEARAVLRPFGVFGLGPVDEDAAFVRSGCHVPHVPAKPVRPGRGRRVGDL